MEKLNRFQAFMNKLNTMVFFNTKKEIRNTILDYMNNNYFFDKKQDTNLKGETLLNDIYKDILQLKDFEDVGFIEESDIRDIARQIKIQYNMDKIQERQI